MKYLFLLLFIPFCYGFQAIPPLLLRKSPNKSITMVSDIHSVYSIPEFIGWYAAGCIFAKTLLYFIKDCDK